MSMVYYGRSIVSSFNYNTEEHLLKETRSKETSVLRQSILVSVSSTPVYIFTSNRAELVFANKPYSVHYREIMNSLVI